MLSKNILYHGRERPPTRRRSLRAGPLTLLFEEDATMGGALRHIKLGDREILRRVYVAVRDRHWGTVPSTLSDVDVEAGDDSFRITFQVENVAGEINFFWRGTIAGDDRGTVTFIMDGRARSTFLRNRIGLCVLHPMGLAGQPCLVEHADGSLEEGEFPTYIAPHQPFQEMRAISHQVAPGVRAMVRVEGDVFEMEDQRNWTDASYKTYSTPLALPAPVEIEEGTRICQSITLRLEGMSAKGWAAVPSKEPPSFAVADASTHPLPQIGLAMAGHGQPLTEKECGRLRALHPSHLRANLHLTDPDYGAILQRATVEAWALNAPLEMALFLPEAPAGELGDLVKRLETLHPPVCRWLVFQQGAPTTPERAVRLVREHLADYAPRARFGGGTDRYFTELNRNRPPVEALDLVCYSLNPQVHAFDGLSLVEALRTQAVTVESARRFVGNLPLVVGPITLRPRSNPHTGETLAGDPRQVSLLGAGWTAGSLKYVAEGGAYGVTYYETTGWRGVMEREKSQDRSNAFPSIPGAVYPLYHVLADVAAYAGGCIVPSASSDRLRVDGLALEKGGRRRILLANLGPDPRRVTVRGLGDDGAAVRHLDETNVEEAMVDPESFRAREGQERETEGGTLDVRLRSYGLARIDTEVAGDA